MTAIAGKSILVTGGRRGLGAALVDDVIARGARHVFSTATTPFADPREQVSTHVLDVRNQASVDALRAEIDDVDIVVNNAGVLYGAPLLTGEFADIAETFDVNVFGALRVTRAFAPLLAAAGGGAVINIHSVLSWLAGSGAYGASKAAIWSLTNSLRVELGSQATHVLGVHAAFIDTDMVTDINMSKSPPSLIAARIGDALESGRAEVLVDEATVAVKSMLSGPVENLTFDTVA